ncbi:MAG: vWA domain-containing protein [Planctomycetota bacterium]
MTWGNWLGALWFLPVLPAIVVLYFLRLKRREIVVSSSLLWSRVLEERRVNSPFQRFRNSLLLILQLLAAAVLIAALARPEIASTPAANRTHVLLIDVSASMAARAGDATRLAEAKRLAGHYIDALPAGERGAVISFARRAKAVTPVTDDRGVLARAVASLEVIPGSSQIDDAMGLAQALVQNYLALSVGEELGVGEAVAVVFSDGGFPAWPGEGFPLPANYIQVGEAASNSGVVALAARLDFERPGTLQIYTEVRNFSTQPAAGFVSILQDGLEVKAARADAIEAGGKWSRSFETDAGAGLIEVRWQPESDDALELDNRAWLAVGAQQGIKVWRIGADNFLLDGALAVLPNVEVTRVAAADVAPFLLDGRAPPDLLVWNRVAPAELPRDVPQLYFGALPPGVWSQEAATIRFPPIVSWNRGHPVNRYLTFGALDQSIEEARVLKPAPGVELLLETSEGGLIATYSAAGQRGIVVSFDTLQSNWPVQLSFPLFLYNAVAYLTTAEGATGMSLRCEELLTVRVPRTVKTCELHRPDGRRDVVEPDATGTVRYADTNALGPYLVSWRPAVAASPDIADEQEVIPVNLLAARESDLTPVTRLEIAGQQISSSQQPRPVSREYWPWVLALALLVVCVEWNFYHRP